MLYSSTIESKLKFLNHGENPAYRPLSNDQNSRQIVWPVYNHLENFNPKINLTETSKPKRFNSLDKQINCDRNFDSDEFLNPRRSNLVREIPQNDWRRANSDRLNNNQVHSKISLSCSNLDDSLCDVDSNFEQTEYERTKFKSLTKAIRDDIIKDMLKEVFLEYSKDTSGFISIIDAYNILINLNNKYKIPYTFQDIINFYTNAPTFYKGYFNFQEFCRAFEIFS
ncbi:unnamed protein product [Brachionus calyciflorus]|uniref:EF-hand domain-containing protein n=1 Tax=Brachionus calyciflorus TaxID=104777 RepID=A0A813WVG5_9BILA|nr:unnamed protein product [Brachionus calyciflorus]